MGSRNRKLRIENKAFSDAQIFKLADLGCYPAFCEFSIRAFKKDSLLKKHSRLENKYLLEKMHMPEYKGLFATGLPKFKAKAALLTAFHTKLYQIPLRFFVSPLNGSELNKALLSQKFEIKLKDIVFNVNIKKLSLNELNNQDLSSKSMNDLILSIIWVNWHLKTTAYRRPPSKKLQFFFTSEEVKNFQLLPKAKFLKSISMDTNEGKKIVDNEDALIFIRLASVELAYILNRMSSVKISNLKRLIYILKNLNVIDQELLNFLPIYSLINKRSYTAFGAIKRLHEAGYTRILHADILSENFINLLSNKKVLSALKARLIRGLDS